VSLSSADLVLIIPRGIPSQKADFSEIAFGAVLVFHDSRDWGRDIQISMDIISSHSGRVTEPKDISIPKEEWIIERQPVQLRFSNPDLIWGNDYPEPRLGQGAFQQALKSVWDKRLGKPLYSYVA
jgi:ribonucleotide monophosphatase NagD (HAD superfamily)